MTVAGGVVAAGGAVLWAVLWSGKEEPPAGSLVPLIGPGVAGLTYSGEF
jgi:hypothetical protein